MDRQPRLRETEKPAERYPVLLVEDNPVSRRFIEKILESGGYRVTPVQNGREAVEEINRAYYPIIITDWVMPEMSGIDLCREVRERKTEGYVYIILLTAKVSKGDIVEGLESGADDYLSKPVHPAELKARIQTGVRILELEHSLRKANEEVRKLSITDPLTGCYNRGYLNERLPQEIHRAVRYARPLSIAMCDLDHFKRINDTYGHGTGDAVLKYTVDLIRASIRKRADWIARFGGEEFVMVLPETGLSGAGVLVERIRSRLASTDINACGNTLRVTASFGVIGFDGASLKKSAAPPSTEAIMNRADRLLYRSKREGRNRVFTEPFMFK